MSPRRMDISSLLRDPSPQHDDSPPLPPSLQNILNPRTHRPPFLGLDALVHVASEERRRITADHSTYPPDLSRSHKRSRDDPPSPSPVPSPTTLRSQFVDPTVLSPSVRPSPFLYSPHPSPRNHSPHRHSPQFLRSQHYSSPVPAHTSSDTDAISPRYGYGPKMAGGIEVLSSDPSPVRNLPRPDFSFYQSPGRDLPVERLISESHTEHARHELPKLSPQAIRAFSLDDDKRQLNSTSLESPESVFTRERAQSHPHRPFINTTVLDLPIRHPIRVWEEPPTASEASRRVSPVRVPAIVSDPVETRTWLPTAGQSRRRELPDNIMSRQDVVENVSAPLSACEQQLPPCRPTLESMTGAQRTCLDARTSLPIPPEPQPCSTLPMAVSPVVGFHLGNFETQSDTQTSPLAPQIDVAVTIPPAPSDPIVAEPVSNISESMHTCAAMNISPKCDPLPRQPFPEPVQAAPTLEPGLFVSPAHANTSQSTSTSPLQQPLFSTKEEPHQDIPVSTRIRPESAPRLSPEREHKREPPVLEQAMMDVDEELLSLVEDRPARVDSKQAQPADVCHQAGPSSEQSREASGGPSSVPSSQPVAKSPLMTTEEKDRASMPPPPARNRKAEKDKTNSAGATAGSKKKKDTMSKPTAKPKQPQKPRAKPAPKSKPKPNMMDPSSKASIPKVTVNASARSRSTSAIPGTTVEDIVPEVEAEDGDKEDDKLYCVCKTRYDEDRMMIACDRCDEWFHTMCVDMPDLEIDLVDQFVCPPCVQKHPHLRTTWKRRCLFGLQHESPSSPEACHKPSRGVFSKYCSDDCGIKFMQARIARWEKSGGLRHLLWESVKNAPKREGVVVRTETDRANPRMVEIDHDDQEAKPLDSAAKRRAQREVIRLNVRLEGVVKERELMKRQLDMVIWREKVVELASERAGKLDECGWDQRLCFGEEECADFGSEVLESYEEEQSKMESGDDAVLPEATSAAHGEWWCTGKKKCSRHAGWQKLRAAEVSFDKEIKEGILLKLTTREREIRKWIEDILYPQPTGTLQASLPVLQLNGLEKSYDADYISEGGEK